MSPAGNRRQKYPDLAGQDADLTARHLTWMRQRGLAATTIYHRKRHLIRLAAYLGTPLADATADQLADWRAGLGTGTAATNGAIACAHQFYAWLSEREKARGDNPAADLIRPKRPRRFARPIPEAQLLAAMETAPPRIRIWLVLAAWAGLRACEIALLRRECVLDQAESPVLIIAADATKGGAAHVVPMSRFVLTELIAYGMPASGWLFTRRDGRPGPNTPARISHLVNAYLHSLGFTATLHMLRHRFGVQTYRKSGHDSRAVQEMLGHADPASTAIYTAFDLPNGFDAVNALPMPPTVRPLRVIEKNPPAAGVAPTSEPGCRLASASRGNGDLWGGKQCLRTRTWSRAFRPSCSKRPASVPVCHQTSRSATSCATAWR